MNEEELTILLEKINSIATNIPSDLHDELYPKELGKSVRMMSPELRLIVLAKYEGIALVLEKLGADVSKIENMIDEESKKL